MTWNETETWNGNGTGCTSGFCGLATGKVVSCEVEDSCDGSEVAESDGEEGSGNDV